MSVSTTFIHLARLQNVPVGWSKPVVFGNAVATYRIDPTLVPAQGTVALSLFTVPSTDPSPYDGKYQVAPLYFRSAAGVHFGRALDISQARPPALGDYVTDQYGDRWVRIYADTCIKWPLSNASLKVAPGSTPAPSTVPGRTIAADVSGAGVNNPLGARTVRRKL